MSDLTPSKIAGLRRACNSLFASNAFRFGVRDLARLIAGKPDLESNQNLDRRFASTPNFYSQGLHGLARLCSVITSSGLFEQEEYLDRDTLEFVLPLRKAMFIFSPLTLWQFRRFFKDCCRHGVLQIRRPKKYRGRKPHPERYSEERQDRKGWTTELRVRVNTGRIQEILANFKTSKAAIPEQGAWVPPPPRFPGDTEIGTRQITYFRTLTDHITSITENEPVHPSRPLRLPIDLDEQRIIEQWHELQVGRPWGDRMNDVCTWIWGAANVWHNRNCDRRRNRVPTWMERFIKTLLAFHAVDQKKWRFKEPERFYFNYWFSTCPAEVCKLANITPKQYRSGMELLMGERVGLLDRERDHTWRRGSRVFFHFNCERWLWILANIDEWKKEKRGRAEEIMEEALKSLAVQKNSSDSGPRPSALNLRFSNPVEHGHLPIDCSDASHPLCRFDGQMARVPAFEREPSSASGVGTPSFLKEDNSEQTGNRDCQLPHSTAGFPAKGSDGTHLENQATEVSMTELPGAVPAETIEPKVPSLPEGPPLTRGENRLGEAVFEGQLDREGQKILEWLARMFGRNLITGDVLRRVQAFRCLPGHKRLTLAKLLSIESEIRNTPHPDLSTFPGWLYGMFGGTIGGGVSFANTEVVDEAQRKALAVFLNAWPGQIAFAVARLDWADYEDELDLLEGFKNCQFEWKSRVEQLERAPRKFLNWAFQGHAEDFPLWCGGGSLDDVAFQLFLFAQKQKWPAEITYLILGARVLKLLRENPMFFLATDSICQWSSRLGLSRQEIDGLNFPAEDRLYRAKWQVEQAKAHGALVLSHFSPSTSLTLEDFIDDPPPSPDPTSLLPGFDSLSEEESINIAFAAGVFTEQQVKLLQANRIATK